MLKLLFNNLKIIINLFFLKLIFVICICCIFLLLFLFQFEIILYFFPDIIILNLNDLFSNEIIFTTNNKFNLLKGYIFVDGNYFHKSSLISISYSVIKYKKYKRRLHFMRSANLSKKRKQGFKEQLIIDHIKNKNPFNRLFRRYAKPLFIRYLSNSENRNLYARIILLKDLFNISTFYQKLLLLFWEFSELSSVVLKKRKFYRRIVLLRNVIHSYPNYKIRKIDARKNYRPRADILLFRKWNILKNYNNYNVYKKFSNVIYYNFFINNIEPYRFYKIYKEKRKGPGLVLSEYLYEKVDCLHVVTYKEVMFGWGTFYTEMGRPLPFWREPQGFEKHKLRFAPEDIKNAQPHRYRFRSTVFYNEKYLLNADYDASLRFKIFLKELSWRFNQIDFTSKTLNSENFDLLTSKRQAPDMRSRAGHWLRIFTRYGYKNNNFFFKNYDNNFFFKKFYIKFFNDLFYIPNLFKFLNFFDFIYLNYYKLNNFFMQYYNNRNYYFYYYNIIKRPYHTNKQVNNHFFPKKDNYKFKFFFYVDLVNFCFNFFKFLIKCVMFCIFSFFAWLKFCIVLLKQTKFFNFIQYFYSFIIYKPFFSIYYFFEYKIIIKYLKLIKYFKDYFRVPAFMIKDVTPYVRMLYLYNASQLRYFQRLRYYFEIISGFKYFKKLKRILFFYFQRFQFFHSSTFYSLNKKFVNFENVSFFFSSRKLFNFSVNRIIFIKYIFISFILYIYFLTLYKFWKVLTGDFDIFSWEYFIFIFLFVFLAINIGSNQHIFAFF